MQNLYINKMKKKKKNQRKNFADYSMEKVLWKVLQYCIVEKFFHAIFGIPTILVFHFDWNLFEIEIDG